MSRQMLKIKDVCTFVGGSQPPKEMFKSEYQEGYIRLIQTRDYKTDKYITYIPENSTTKFCDVEDIMIGRYGPPVFQICRGIKGAYNVALMKAIPKSNILNSYLYYYLKQEAIFYYVDRLSKRTGGQTGVDLVALNQYPIYLPDLKEQKLIAQILSNLDSKIELNKRINRELEQIAKLLYDYWFVQFDFPNEQGKPYKSSGGKMVYNKELKQEIPEGWKSGTVSKLLSFNPTTSLAKGEIASYIDMNALPVEGFMTKSIQKKEFSGGVKFQNGDVLFARITPCLENGKTGLVTLLGDDDEVGFGSTEFIVIRGKKRNLSGFASNLSRSELFRKYAILNMTGTSGRKRIDAKVLETLSIPIPPGKLLDKYEKLVANNIKKATINTKENQNLTQLRDWLLPMLMNGQISVKQAQQKVAETLNIAAEPQEKY